MKTTDKYGYKRKRIDRENLLKVEKPFPGETIEQKVARITLMGEPIEDGAPTLYDQEGETEVDARCDIRQDKWDIAEREIENNNAKNATQALENNAGTLETPNTEITN